ncbi:hypothetical protein Trydic_g13978 [Trypoxylus dichotomus]
MKAILFLAGFCALALAVPTPTKVIPKKYQISDSVQLERQLNILRLYRYVTQPIFYKELADIATNYNPETQTTLYTKPEYVTEFMYYYHYTILPKERLFSVFDYQHLKQAIALFKMLYYAKDYDTFFKTAVWARENVNEYMWTYSFTVALVHRTDTFGLITPPLYEIFPYYFFNSEIIYKAQYYKQIYHGEYPKSSDYTGYTINSNFTDLYLNKDKEQFMLSYFTEDIDLNYMNYYRHIFYPFWMDGKEFGLDNDQRGQLYYGYYQLLWAKYYSERLSQRLPEIPMLNPTLTTLEPGYYPSLEYPNGMQFPSRPPYTSLTWDTSYNTPYYNFTNSYVNVLDYFRRMRDALSLGYVYTETGTKISLFEDKGIEIFANLVEGNPNSPDVSYYGILEMYVRNILGYGITPVDKDHLIPSAVLHYETALRDPAYWYFVKWVVYFFQEYKLRQPQPFYSVKDLQFEGVKVLGMQVERLVTYFEIDYTDLSNAVFYDKRETDPFLVRVRQPRLTHKPFTYTIDVESDKVAESIVRVYIGPKYDYYGRKIDFNENRLNFYIIDKFIFSLQTGKNTITRSSKLALGVSDRTSYWQLYKRVMGAIKGTEPLVIDGSETYWGLPNRLLLPHGTTGGMPYQFFVIVTPFVKGDSVAVKQTDERVYPRVGTGFYIYDKRSLGFPFDLPVKDSYVWTKVTNKIFYDVKIYHKDTEELLNVST